MNGDTLCRHGVSRDWEICEACLLEGSDPDQALTGLMNSVPAKPDWGAIQDAKNAFMARHYRRDSGHPGSKTKVSAAARKAKRKRERQARKAGRR